MTIFSQIEPDLGTLEDSYRESYLKSDASQAIFVIGLSNLASLALIRSDYQSFGLDPKFFMFLTARISVFLVSCAAVYILAKSTQPKLHDRAVASYMLAGALINIFINFITPPSYIAYIGVSLVLLNIYYFALFTPLAVRTTISYLFSMVVIFQVYQTDLANELGSVVMGMHLLTNVIGTAISAKLYTQRRLGYKAQMEEKELQMELNRLASADPLTGVYNRRKFTDEAAAEFERAKRYKRPLSLILIDVDRLKAINDTYGHLAGDEAIRHCAQILSAQIREPDILGRLGGDEFGVLLPETQLSEGVTVGMRIQESGRQKTINLDGSAHPVTFSLGIAELDGKDAGYDDFFRRADKALYQAKESGRNAMSIAESGDDARQ